jgi:hypothetical protein
LRLHSEPGSPWLLPVRWAYQVSFYCNEWVGLSAMTTGFFLNRYRTNGMDSPILYSLVEKSNPTEGSAGIKREGQHGAQDD